MATDLGIRAIRSSIVGTLVMAAVLFLAAGTLDYWQAWVFLVVFAGASAFITVYLAIYSPALLERRMRVGPTAETEPTQKIVMSLAMMGFATLFVLPAVDVRFGWSRMPTSVSIVGDLLIALSFAGFWLVFKENPFGASTIQVADDQRVIATGPYGLLRHPMYAAGLLLMVGTPLALGSWWSVLVLVVLVPVIIWRLLDEERFLKLRLPGYAEYMQQVRYRLVPFVW